MNNYESDCAVLKDFLSLPHRSEILLERFAALPEFVRKKGNEKEGFVYFPGTRKNKVLLIAHAATVGDPDIEAALEDAGETLRNAAGILGAEDRAGCAMLWLLRESGHGLLITDGEEGGSFGAKFMKEKFPEMFDEINGEFQFMIQIDRCGSEDFKCYKVGTDAFRSYVNSKTGFTEPGILRGTDIVHLCRDICGVNLSCGYHEEHTENEYIVKKEWHNTLELLRKWLAEEDLPKFALNK